MRLPTFCPILSLVPVTTDFPYTASGEPAALGLCVEARNLGAVEPVEAPTWARAQLLVVEVLHRLYERWLRRKSHQEHIM